MPAINFGGHFLLKTKNDGQKENPVDVYFDKLGPS